MSAHLTREERQALAAKVAAARSQGMCWKALARLYERSRTQMWRDLAGASDQMEQQTSNGTS